jgi:hypothetical protein
MAGLNSQESSSVRWHSSRNVTLNGCDATAVHIGIHLVCFSSSADELPLKQQLLQEAV